MLRVVFQTNEIDEKRKENQKEMGVERNFIDFKTENYCLQTV